MIVSELIAALSREPFDREVRIKDADHVPVPVRRVDVDSHTGGVVLITERRETMEGTR